MTNVCDLGVIIGVKDLNIAKSRLMGVFSPQHRERLVLAILADTIAAVRYIRMIGPIVVVTPDHRVAALAAEMGALAVRDPTSRNDIDPLNAALIAGEAKVRTQTCNCMVLQGDLPSLRPAELTRAINAACGFPRNFVADRHYGGTSALFAFGASLRPCFGAKSAERHRRSGAVELTGMGAGLRCDIDTAEDLCYATGLGLGSKTEKIIDLAHGIPLGK